MGETICRNFKALTFISLLFAISACATATPQEVAGNRAGEIANGATRKAASEAGDKLSRGSNRNESVTPAQPNSTTYRFDNDRLSSRENINARVLQKQKAVKVKSAASNKSRSIARLKGGQQIQVLEEKGSWLKIRWQAGEKIREGWLKRRFVELM